AIVHARSYVSSLVALGCRGASDAKFIFDMRGFWVDEKIEAGHWRRAGRLVRLARYWERRFLDQADAIVSLTESGVDALPSLGYRAARRVPVVVIPTCADLERFRPGSKDDGLARSLGLDG